MSPNPALLTWPRPVAGGAAGDVTLIQSGFSTSNTVVLGATPTPGNHLIVAAGGASPDPTSWTFSHALTLDDWGSQSGWRVGIASGIVAGGDSATVTITGLSSTTPGLAVWEVSGLSSGLVDSDWTGSTGSTTVDPTVIDGAFIVAFAQLSGNSSSAPSSSTLTLISPDTTVARHIAGYAVDPTLPAGADFSWGAIRAVSAIAGGYA